jgi:maltose/moltooligosaccharide transporter
LSIGAFAFFTAVLWTVIKSKEYPPEDMDKFLKEKEENKGVFNGLKQAFLGIFSMPKTMVQLAFVQFFSWFALFAMWIYTTSGVTSHVYDMKLSQDEIQHLKGVFDQSVLSAPEDFKKRDIKQIEKDFEEYNESISGTGLATINVNFAKFFADESSQLKVSPEVSERLVQIQKNYNDGADWVGVLFALYNGIAAVFALALPWLAKTTSRKITHLICLIAGGLGLISIFFIGSPNLLLLSMIGVGIAWASILSVPYAMLAGALPANKMGYYMGVFNFFIVIPQIVAAGILGFILRNFFDNQAIFALVVGGVSMILAGLLTLMVKDTDDVRVQH